MEPFSISCTTCQAKLRVRDRSAIGQILTCPKCGSMVLIEAPAEQGRPEQGRPEHGRAEQGRAEHGRAEQGPSTSQGASSIPASSARPAVRPPSPSSPTPAATGPAKRPDQFADTVEDPTRYGTTENRHSEGETSEHSIAESGVEEVFDWTSAAGPDSVHSEHTVSHPDFVAEESDRSAENGSAPLHEERPEADWSSQGAQNRRRWLLAGVALLAGVLLALVTFVLVIGRGGKPIAQPSPSATVPIPPPSATDSGNREKTTLPESVPPADSTTVPSVPTQELPPTTAMESPVGGTERPAELPVESPTASPPALPTESTAAAKPPTPPMPPELPTDLVPQNDVARADRMAPGGALTDTLRKLGGLFDDDEGSPEKPMEPTAAPDTATPTESLPAVPSDASVVPMSRPESRVVDVAARLKDPIVEVEFPGIPLQDFLTFISTYSTIPVTLDPDMLVWMNLTPDTPVNLKVANTTVANLLDAALGKLGLVAVPTGQQIDVTRKPPGGEGLRNVQRKADDLVGTDPNQTQHLQELLTSLIAPDSWSAVGGPGKIEVTHGQLQIEQSDQVLLETSAFLERLRVARGLPKQSKFPEKLFLPVSRTARAESALAKSVTLNYPRAASFPKIVRRLGLESNVTILVDWQAIAEIGWSPDAEAMLTVTSQPLHEALQALLTPMELTYRIVDESLLQITTPAALASRPEIEFYPVGDLLGEAGDEEAFLKRMREALPSDWLVEAGGNGVLRFDPPSRCLVALLPQPRQQVVEQLLQKWKVPSK